MEEVAQYTFSPWLRRGIINNIPDTPPSGERAIVNIPVDVSIEGGASNSIAKENIEQYIQLYGPGDIIGIQPMAIVRTEPQDGTMEFENNYMPFIEFFEEDFPWRYSPIAPVGNKLDPWLSLIALKEEEIDKSEGGINWEARPLPSVILNKPAYQNLPNNKEQWAWAHTHISYQNKEEEDPNLGQDKEVDYNIFQKTTLNSSPDAAYSRILCPRKLEPETRYYMFLIPAYETGRLAGLGLPTNTNECNATTKAWDEKSTEKKEKRLFPFYYHWRFKTGTKGDFEYLVTLLKAKPAKDIHEQLGKRPMDVSRPYPDKTFEGIDQNLELEGALMPPGMVPTNWVPTTESGNFVKNLSERINNSIINRLKGQSNSNSNESSYLPPPFYAQWQAWANRVDVPSNANIINWIQELNLDPRHRVTAALGAQVIQKSQDEYLQDAWNQVSGIVSVNQKLQESEFAIAASEQFFAKHFKPLSQDRMLMITSPVHNRILMGATTIARSLYDSPVSTVLSSPSFRRIARPIGPVMKKKVYSGGTANLFDKVNRRNIELFPLNKDLGKAFTFQKVAEAKLAESLLPFVNKPGGIPSNASLDQQLQFIDTQIKQGKFVQALSAAKGRYFLLQRSSFTKSFAAEAIDYFNSTLPIVQVGKKRILTTKQKDSVQFLAAVKDVYALFEKQPLPLQAKSAIKLIDLQKAVMAKLSPKYVLGRKWEKLIPFPEEVGPLMAYPEFHRPMYKPLAELSGDFMLPNMQFVPQNTITVLESNDRFIEAYMAGLNHEMSRELLWQEYPTDMRGSYFRQFWDISDYIPFEDLVKKYWNADLQKEEELLKKTLEIELSKESLAYLNEKYGEDDVAVIVGKRVSEWKNWKINQIFKGTLKDIEPMSDWPKNTKLGDHTRKISTGSSKDSKRLVLLIRGDLLRRYPNTVIYAQKAKDKEVNWKINDKTYSIVPEGYKFENNKIKYPNDDELDSKYIKFPVFKGFVAPDVYLLGFDMSVDDALKGLGWFFIIKERPGEPRFGLDVLDPNQKISDFSGWNSLCWDHIEQPWANAPYLSPLSKIKSKNTNDEGIKWGQDAAQMAHILYQVPTLVAYHAKTLIGQLIGK